MQLSLVVEGRTDVPIARRLASDAGFIEVREHICEGKAKLDAMLGKYLEAARWHPYLILRDLDDDADCAPAWVGARPAAKWCALRLAVRSAECWLMADRERFAAFLGISVDLVARDPDSLPHPKEQLLSLAARSSKRRVREGMCPAPGRTVPVGLGYTPLLTEFVTNEWRPTVAERASPSLRSARSSVRELARRWRATSSAGT